ncbi:hypothetical protein ACWGJ9_09415 [Curtobacterium citreum]
MSSEIQQAAASYTNLINASITVSSSSRGSRAALRGSATEATAVFTAPAGSDDDTDVRIGEAKLLIQSGIESLEYFHFLGPEPDEVHCFETGSDVIHLAELTVHEDFRPLNYLDGIINAIATSPVAANAGILIARPSDWTQVHQVENVLTQVEFGDPAFWTNSLDYGLVGGGDIDLPSIVYVGEATGTFHADFTDTWNPFGEEVTLAAPSKGINGAYAVMARNAGPIASVRVEGNDVTVNLSDGAPYVNGYTPDIDYIYQLLGEHVAALANTDEHVAAEVRTIIDERDARMERTHSDQAAHIAENADATE